MGSLESDTTEWLHFHFSLLCIGGGNGNPLQCSCLENPRDGGAWWAAIYGVAQSRTRLKQHSSSSRRNTLNKKVLCRWFLFCWVFQLRGRAVLPKTTEGQPTGKVRDVTCKIERETRDREERWLEYFKKFCTVVCNWTALVRISENAAAWQYF